jgi:predicted Zn-dependent protease
MTYRTRCLAVAILVPALALAPACTQVENPATGRTEYTTLSPEQERELGAQQHPRILQQFGGAYPDEELRAYVEAVGQQVAASSDLPDAEFTFTLLDSEVPNAFALPGGYVYITRGLLALAETEAEMAGVLGHEIGHVTARHAAQRQTRATGAGVVATLGTIAAAVLGGEAAGQLAQQAAGVGTQAYLAGYSRDQEFQADDLGVGYMTAAGYDPEAMATFLEKLAAESELDRTIAGADGDPAESWFATHPRTLDRVQRAANEAKASSSASGREGREEYLARIDGLIYGEDPRQGLVRGQQFIHPDLGFEFEAPPGFALQNTPQAVLARDPAGRLMIFAGADLDGRSPEAYVAGPGMQQVAQALNVEVGRPRNVRAFQVDGLPGASASATAGQQGRQADLGLAVIEAGQTAYQFIFLSAGQISREEARAYEATINSFHELTPQEAARFRPQRIEVVEVAPGEDAATLASRMAVDEGKRRRFEIINALALRQGLSPGDEVKLILSEN